MRLAVKLIVISTALGVLSAVAVAQPATSAAGSGDTASKTAAPNTDLSKHDGTLTEKLRSTNGVIHPEGDIDPGIHKPAPDTGATRIVPPPQSFGGSGSIEPK